MRIVSWNVNGLRAAIKKGFEKQIEKIAPDVLLLQEVRALPEQLPAEWREPEGWHVHWHPAERKGYSGVAVLAREPFKVLGRGIGKDDLEGRVLVVEFRGVILVNVYLPSGSSGDHRQLIKEEWMVDFLPWAEKLRRKRKPVVMGGDFNIAETEKDIFYAKSNEKTSGFLPHERKWLTDLKANGWHDFVREQFGDVDGPYSWWSNRGQARKLDRGWRIDYLFGNKAAGKLFKQARVYREESLEVSDHAPVGIDLKK